jgi:hypothetical protein
MNHHPPRAPWGSFPLSELCVLLALTCGITGFLISGPPGMTLVAAAVSLGCLAGLEITLREHLAGHRPHALLLSAAVAIPVMTALVAAGAQPGVAVALGAATFFAAVFILRRGYSRRRATR